MVERDPRRARNREFHQRRRGRSCDGPKDDPKLFSYKGYEYMKLDDEASYTKDPVVRETAEHMLTMECLMYNRVKGFMTWTFEDA